MDMATRAAIKADLKRSPKMLPLTLALIKAATEQGASITEFKEACEVAEALFQDDLNHLSTGKLKGDSNTAFERFHELLSAFLP